MMKKLSKIALLAAASAFMLAVFPACGDDDEEADPKATLTLVGDAVELEKDTPKAVTATVTLENDTFSAEAKESIPANVPIPTDFFELKAGTGVSVSAATLVEWTSDTVAKINFTVTAAAGAADGTISAEIKEGTLSSNKILTTAGNISYTIKSTGKDPVPSVKILSEATTVEVDGTFGLKAQVSNFPEGVTYEWTSDKTNIATVVQNPKDMTQAQVTAIAAGTAKIKVTVKSGNTEKSDEVTVTVNPKGSVGDEGKGGVVWTFKDVTFGEGTMAGLTTASKLQADVELTATSGTGATLTALSQSTFKEDNEKKRGLKTDASKKFNAIADVTFGVKGIGSSDASKGAIKGALKLVLSADAKVVLKGLISGTADLRYLLLADADEKILKIVPETQGDATEQTIEQTLKAGTYYIGLDGFILASVECK